MTPWTAACQAPLSSTVSQSLLKLMSIESLMLSNHLILCCPLLLCLQSFPESGSFPVSQFHTLGGQIQRKIISKIQLATEDSLQMLPPQRRHLPTTVLVSPSQTFSLALLCPVFCFFVFTYLPLKLFPLLCKFS